MDNENKLNIEKWPLKLDDKIKYMLSLEKNFTFILTKKYFYIYEQNKDLLTKYSIPPSILGDIKISKSDESLIWSDTNGNHVIFKIDKISYYYNNILPENNKIKELNLLINNEYVEPYSFAFNNNNQNTKNTDEIIFSDKNSNIYTLNIKIEENGEIQEKVNKVFDFRNLDNSINNDDNTNDENKEKEIKLSELLDDNNFFLEKDDRIYDMKLYVYEEKKGTGKKAIIERNYFLLAVSKRIIFQFKGNNSISEIFSKYKTENNLLNRDELLKDCKIFPRVPKFGLEKTRIQIFKSKEKKNYFCWNNECGFCIWPLLGSPIPTPQKEFNLYNYIKLNNDGKYEKNPCPIMCCQTSKCIYFLYSDSIVVLNNLTNNIIQVEYLKEEYLDIYYNSEMNILILYSSNNIMKISLEYEYNNLWKDYIEKGDYNLALQFFPLEDNNLKSKLHKLNGDLLFKRKDYELSGMEYAFSDENFEHICLKFLKLNDINPLINYLNFVNKIRLTSNEKDDNDNEIFFIQKYLINTWLLELLLENEDIIENKNIKDSKTNKQKKPEKKSIKTILYDSGYIDTYNLIDKRIIYNSLICYGRSDDYIYLAGMKNDYKDIIFHFVNHNQYKNAINELILYMSYSTDELFLKNLFKIFFIYVNIFIKESPKEVIQLLNKYYYLIEKPSEIVRIITNINIYKNDVYEEYFDNVLILIKKLINLTKKNKNINDINKKDIYDLSLKENLYNLYILYLSISVKVDHYNELLNYLKSLVNNSNPKNNYYFNNNIDNTIYFEYSFVINILKQSRSALALIYCLKKEYNRSISISLSYGDRNTSIFIANSISDPKKKKEIWLEIFNHFKSYQEIDIFEDIINQSQGVLKILDILPHLMGNMQLGNIKSDLKNCINLYESKLKKLRINIKEYSLSTDLITQKLNIVSNEGKKSLKLNFDDVNCTICLRNLKEMNFYLFPCRHAFDFDCLTNLLFYYDTKKIGDETFKKKMIGIKQLIHEIKQLNLRKKSVYEKKNSLNQKEKKQNIVTGFFRNLTFRDNKSDINFTNEEEIQLLDLENVLDELLTQECPLCGNELILSTQIKFGDEDNSDWLI